MSVMPAGEANPAIPTLIVGVGNEVLQDEGVGVHVVRALERCGLPEHIGLVNGATDGLALLGRFDGVQRLVLVDAMDMRCAPGTIITVRPDEVRRLHAMERMSLHGMGLLDALDVAAALGLLPPEVYIVGVQPAVVAWGLELSEAVREALPKVVEAVLSVALGAQGTRKELSPYGQVEANLDHR